jgi:BCCIP
MAEEASPSQAQRPNDEEDVSAPRKDPGEDGSGSASESSSSSDDDDEGDLDLQGALVRNPDDSSSSSDEEEDDDDGDDEDGEGESEVEDNKDDNAQSNPSLPESIDSKKRRPIDADGPNTKATQRKNKKKRRSSPDTIQVRFTFHDMDEKFFHGLKSLLHNSSTAYQPFSSDLADLMIDNVSVGTVISTEGDDENNVYGFASVLNLRTNKDSKAIQNLRDLCTRNCPAQHAKDLELVLSGSTKRPAGLLLHGRMINLPLDITLVLHQQLVLDMDWAVENAEGGEEERKSLDFGAFVRIAPCQQGGGGGGGGANLLYRFFDDEVFAGRAEFSFTIDAPKSYSKEVPLKLHVMVLTKTGHRQAMNDLEQMVGPGAAS